MATHIHCGGPNYAFCQCHDCVNDYEGCCLDHIGHWCPEDDPGGQHCPDYMPEGPCPIGPQEQEIEVTTNNADT